MQVTTAGALLGHLPVEKLWQNWWSMALVIVWILSHSIQRDLHPSQIAEVERGEVSMSVSSGNVVRKCFGHESNGMIHQAVALTLLSSLVQSFVPVEGLLFGNPESARPFSFHLPHLVQHAPRNPMHSLDLMRETVV